MQVGFDIPNAAVLMHARAEIRIVDPKLRCKGKKVGGRKYQIRSEVLMQLQERAIAGKRGASGCVSEIGQD